MVAFTERARLQVKRVGEVTHKVEEAALKIPSSAIFGFGLACCTASTALALAKKDRAAMIIGMWAPASFALGLCLQMQRHDQRFQEHAAHA